MKVEALGREFRYNGGLRLPDPKPKLAVEEVISRCMYNGSVCGGGRA